MGTGTDVCDFIYVSDAEICSQVQERRTKEYGYSPA